MSRLRLIIPADLQFATVVPVRISDVNYGGHLGNDALLSILHEARLQFLQAHGFTEQNVGGIGLIMLDAQLQYRSEAFYGDRLQVAVDVADLQSAGFDIVYRVTKETDRKEVALAKTGMGFFDYSRRKIVSMPEVFRTAFSLKGHI